MSKNALATLSLANLAALARGESVDGIDDAVGAMDYDDVDGIDDANIGAADDDEVDGVDDVDGIDDSDIGRARRRRGRKPRRAKWRGRRILGLGATSIGAGATETISVSPSHTFQPQRAVFEGTGLYIVSVSITGQNQLENSELVPVALFSGTGADLNFVFDVCPRNSKIDIVVNNPTAGAVVFSGGILGLFR